MAFCPNCGRELMDGEVCNCTATETPVADQTTYDQTAYDQAAYDQTVYDQNAYNQQYAQDPQQQQYYSQDPQQQQYYQQPAYNMPARTDYPEGYPIKKKYVAVILAALLGVFGIHNFYLGDKQKGIIHAVLGTIGLLFVGIGFTASLIWAVVEFVQLLTESVDADANGFKIQTLEEALNKKD